MKFKDLSVDLFDFRVKPANPEVIVLNKFQNGATPYWSDFRKNEVFTGRKILQTNVKYVQVTPEVEAILTQGGINCNESSS